MKIRLETPYKELYKNGYLVTNKENRKHVVLYNSPKNRSTVSYARYLMSCKLGYIIPAGLEVDHIDEDKTNDAIDNLQILTKIENHSKTNKVGETMIDFVCPMCHNKFQLTARQSHKQNPTCSKVCGRMKAVQTKKLNKN